MEHQPERALILYSTHTKTTPRTARRNGASAREGIDTMLSFLFWLAAISCRNGASARKGIDTKAL